MSAIASQITRHTIVYSTVYSDAGQRKYQSSASLAFMEGIHRWPVNSPQTRPVTRKMFPFDDVIMNRVYNADDVPYMITLILNHWFWRIVSLRHIGTDVFSHDSDGLGCESPSDRDIFCLKSIDSSWVENECCYPRTVHISNTNNICACVCPFPRHYHNVVTFGFRLETLQDITPNADGLRYEMWKT